MFIRDPLVVLLITLIGAPLLAAAMLLWVHFWNWLRNPGWFARDVIAALLVGLVVAVVSVLWQKSISQNQLDVQNRIENLRFVRERSSETSQTRPFVALDLVGQNLRGLQLSGADFRESDLRNANFSGAELLSSNLEGADGEGSSFSAADLTGAALDHANFSSAQLSYMNFADGSAEYSNFESAELLRAELMGTRFLASSFVETSLRYAYLQGANLVLADFDYADLTGANLRGADLTDARNLKTALLDNVRWDSATDWPTGFHPPPSCNDHSDFECVGDPPIVR